MLAEGIMKTNLQVGITWLIKRHQQAKLIMFHHMLLLWPSLFVDTLKFGWKSQPASQRTHQFR